MGAYIKTYAVVSQITWHLLPLSKYLSYGLDLNFLQLTAALSESVSGIWLLRVGEGGERVCRKEKERGGEKKISMHFN